MKMFLVHFSTLQIAFSKANTPVKWPGVMSRRGRSPTVAKEVFPENENDGAQLDSFKSTAN